MASFNRVVLLGNCTRDPELRYTPNGAAVTDLGLAVSEKRKGPNGDTIDDVCFVDVTCWNRTAEIACEYLRKGSPVFIEGRLKQESWQDKTSGEKRTKLKVVCERLQLLGGKGFGWGDGQRGGRQQDDGSAEPQGGRDDGGGPPVGDSDIPF